MTAKVSSQYPLTNKSVSLSVLAPPTASHSQSGSSSPTTTATTTEKLCPYCNRKCTEQTLELHCTMCSKRSRPSPSLPPARNITAASLGTASFSGAAPPQRISRDDDSIFQDEPLSFPTLPQPIPSAPAGGDDATTSTQGSSSSAPNTSRHDSSTITTLAPAQVARVSRHSVSSSQLLKLPTHSSDPTISSTTASSKNSPSSRSDILATPTTKPSTTTTTTTTSTTSTSSSINANTSRLVTRDVPVGKIHINGTTTVDVSSTFRGLRNVPANVDHMIRVEDFSGTIYPPFMFCLKENETRAMKWSRDGNKLVEDFDSKGARLKEQAEEGTLDSVMVVFPSASSTEEVMTSPGKSPNLQAANSSIARPSRHSTTALMPPTNDPSSAAVSSSPSSSFSLPATSGYQSSVLNSRPKKQSQPTKRM